MGKFFPSKAHKSWQKCPAFDTLDNIIPQLARGTFYPQDGKDIFSAFTLPVEEIKVVILGLSPYPNTYQGVPNATGVAFAIRDPDRPFAHWPASLKVLAEAVGEVTNQEEDIDLYLVPDLSMWQQSGIFLLNIALTCLKEDPLSHLQLWEPFTSSIVKWIGEQNTGIIWYFLGKEARKFDHLVFDLAHTKFYDAHPAFYARERTRMPSQNLKKIDIIYRHLHGKSINWTLPF